MNTIANIADRPVPRLRSAHRGAFGRTAGTVAWLVLAATVGLLLVVTPAQSSERVGFGEKVYDPVSGRYFEMVAATLGDSIRGSGFRAVGWPRAADNARNMSHNGVQGRLAVVDSQHIHDFLLRTFWPHQAVWIGLRYWCQINRLQWVTGDVVTRGSFSSWGLDWAHRGDTIPGTSPSRPPCDASNRFWPVHYWPVQQGFVWNANETFKELGAYIVEYPTGKP
ncbi:MAG: hypothetical protein EA406_06190 [Rhodospirillales bacterium]|nr:MAG: hypothetical protein EA406_06190 [Rhodospirillales bacterium]